MCSSGFETQNFKFMTEDNKQQKLSDSTNTAIGYIPGYAQVFSHRFPYRWTLKDANFTKDKGKVFSCFACGGGSTMGYKLAGFDVIGCNEIDPKMIEAYKVNNNPKYAFLEPIQTFKMREDLPQELYSWIFWTVRHLVAVFQWLETEKRTGAKIRFLEKDKQCRF